MAYNDSSFDARKYVDQKTSSWVGGVVSDADKRRIEQDNTLTSEQKDAAKRELEHKAALYY